MGELSSQHCPRALSEPPPGLALVSRPHIRAVGLWQTTDHDSRVSAPLLCLGIGGWFCLLARQQLLLLTFSAPSGLLPRCPTQADP